MEWWASNVPTYLIKALVVPHVSRQPRHALNGWRRPRGSSHSHDIRSLGLELLNDQTPSGSPSPQDHDGCACRCH